jgi:hypothetical protein
MTQEHPITPPPELVSKWCYEDGEEIKSSPRWFVSVCAKAARWGSDQELEACCEWLQDPDLNVDTYKLRAARRPKPPSLKEQALEQLDGIATVFRMTHGGNLVCDTIRRALEALPE